MITRKVLFFLAIIISTIVVAQKPQRIGYIDMEYILENVPEYTEAQARLNVRIITWQQKLDGIKREIEIMKADLSNEKPLLTQELIGEREEDIHIKEEDLRKLQAAYFGPKGDLFLVRKQLVKPIQDQIYNAIQNIAIKKKYDIVLDKSSDLIMLYANKKYDVSELVLNSIVRGRKKVQLEEKKNKRQADVDDVQNKRDERVKKKEASQAILKAQQDAKAKLRADRIKANQEDRKKRLEEIENRKNKSTKNVDKTTKVATDSVTLKVTDSLSKVAVKATDSIKDSKRTALLDRIKKQNEAKAKRKKELIKEKEEKRKKRLEELEKRKKAKKEEKENNN